MKDQALTEDGVVAGNVYPKYSTRNPVARYLLRRFMETIDDFVLRADPVSIHEIGCGEGHLLSRYADGNRSLLGTDFSREVIETARALHPDAGIRFEFASIYHMEAGRDGAPLILCCEVLEHLQDPEGAVEKLAALASPYLIASVPREPIWRMLNLMRGQYVADLGNTPGHINHWSTRSFLRLLAPHFEILDYRTPLPWTVALCRRR